jgi:hypothetical protein
MRPDSSPRGFDEANVYEYNCKRLHSALNYLTPVDYHKGEEYIKLRLEMRKTLWKKPGKMLSGQAILCQESWSA